MKAVLGDQPEYCAQLLQVLLEDEQSNQLEWSSLRIIDDKTPSAVFDILVSVKFKNSAVRIRFSLVFDNTGDRNEQIEEHFMKRRVESALQNNEITMCVVVCNVPSSNGEGPYGENQTVH